MKRRLAILALIFAAVSCGQRQESTFHPRPFPQVSVPAMVTDPAEAASYYAGHFWDEFTDTAGLYYCDSSIVNGVRVADVEQAYANYLAFLDMVDLDEAVKSVENLFMQVSAVEAKDTSFEFEFTMDGSRFIYGFSCNRKKVTEEHLTAYNSQRPAKIFRRTSRGYEFYSSQARDQLQPLTERTTPNKLFIAAASAWNSSLTKLPYLWLSSYIDVFDSTNPMLQSLELYEKDKEGKLRSFTNNLLKEADINISDFTIEARDINNPPPFMMNMPVHSIQQKEYKVMTKHIVRTDGDDSAIYQLPLPDESKGTQNLFFLSPFIKKALDKGYVFCVDELDSSMHPALLLYIVNLFNSPATNPKGAQLIMTTHTTDLLATSILRRDQIYFIEKDNSTGISDLYSLNDFPARTREDIRKAYIAGRFGAVPNIR